MEKLGILLLKNHGYHVPCSFGLEMVGDEDLNSWEMIGICWFPKCGNPAIRLYMKSEFDMGSVG